MGYRYVKRPLLLTKEGTDCKGITVVVGGPDLSEPGVVTKSLPMGYYESTSRHTRLRVSSKRESTDSEFEKWFVRKKFMDTTGPEHDPFRPPCWRVEL